MCTFMDPLSDSNQFSRIPAESVALLAENFGLSNQENITTTLVEDASYRVRQIVNVSMYGVYLLGLSFVSVGPFILEYPLCV